MARKRSSFHRTFLRRRNRTRRSLNLSRDRSTCLRHMCASAGHRSAQDPHRQIQSQISGLDAEEQALDRQIALSQANLETQQGLLSEGLTEAPRISALEREIAQLQGQKGELTASRAEAAGRITELEIEISGLATQQREKAKSELRDIVAKETELNQRQPLAERIARLDIRAPTSGLVLGLSVTTPQSVVRPADTLMFIVPQDRPLLVAARVPVTHIDEVKVGKDVRLVFSSLPSRTTPELHGTVVIDLGRCPDR